MVNNMFEKEFLELDLLKRLRNLGFDEPCFAYWSIPLYSEAEPRIIIGDGGINTPVDMVYIPAPLIQQVTRWFRKFNYVFYVEIFSDKTFDYMIVSDKFSNDFDYEDGPFETYEEAEISGIIRIIELLEGERG